jgi:hypothetical protein
MCGVCCVKSILAGKEIREMLREVDGGKKGALIMRWKKLWDGDTF